MWTHEMRAVGGSKHAVLSAELNLLTYASTLGFPGQDLLLTQGQWLRGPLMVRIVGRVNESNQLSSAGIVVACR